MHGPSAQMTVEALIEDPRWASAGLERLATTATDATLAGVGCVPGDWLIGLLGCDDAKIAALNAEFRDRPAATNVLSWPSADRAPASPGAVPAPPVVGDDSALGDIAISYDTCTREAEAAGLSLAQHATHLLVHGTLHLLGYDHETEADAARMETLEVEILATLGVPNPY